MQSKKVYVVGTQYWYSSFIENAVNVDNIEDADIVLFTGGADVTPGLYGAKKHHTTYDNYYRDLEEKEAFDKCVELKNKLVIGVCRGSQFLCVMNGGLLVQDCNNHALAGTHSIVNDAGNVYEITSTHHQMQYPYNLNPEHYKILYYTKRSTYYEGDKIDESLIVKDPEIVLYTTPGLPKCLAIQGHPEMMNENCDTVKMINNLINELV